MCYNELMNKQSIFAVGIAVMMVVSFAPGLASAQTAGTPIMASLQAEVASLLAEVATLQNQLAQMTVNAGTSGGGTSTGTSVGGSGSGSGIAPTPMPPIMPDRSDCLSLNRNLSVGSQGDDVSNLQKTLAADPSVYPQGSVTGYFGPLTAQAVVRFQQKNGIATSSLTGVVGPLTRQYLGNHCGVGIGIGPGSTSTSTNPCPMMIATSSVTVTSNSGSGVGMYTPAAGMPQGGFTSNMGCYYPPYSSTSTLPQPVPPCPGFISNRPNSSGAGMTGNNEGGLNGVVMIGCPTNTSTYPTPPPLPPNTTSTMPGTGTLVPQSGPVGTLVTLHGSGFAATGNMIEMDNLVAAKNISSADGQTLSFGIPSVLVPYCGPNQACAQFILLVTPRTYQVSVVSNGTTTQNIGPFLVTPSQMIPQ